MCGDEDEKEGNHRAYRPAIMVLYFQRPGISVSRLAWAAAGVEAVFADVADADAVVEGLAGPRSGAAAGVVEGSAAAAGDAGVDAPALADAAAAPPSDSLAALPREGGGIEG